MRRGVRNLRTALRWAADHADLATAAAIAAHSALLAWTLYRFEAVGWVEEILVAATAADLRQLPRLYTAAGLCQFTGRPDAAGVGYAETAVALEANPCYEPFGNGWSNVFEYAAHFYAGHGDRTVEICRALTSEPGVAHAGLCGLLYTLPALGRIDEAVALADETVAAARKTGNPWWIAYSLLGYGRAFAQTDPTRALTALRQALDYTREHRILFFEANIGFEAASLEQNTVSRTVVGPVRHHDRFAPPPPAPSPPSPPPSPTWPSSSTASTEPTSLPPSTAPPPATPVSTWSSTFPRPSTISAPVLGHAGFDECVANGATIDLADAVPYARDQIQAARRQLSEAQLTTPRFGLGAQYQAPSTLIRPAPGSGPKRWRAPPATDRFGVAVTMAEARHPNRFPNNLADSHGRDGTSRHELPDQTARNGTGRTVADGRKRTTDQKVGGSSPSERAD